MPRSAVATAVVALLVLAAAAAGGEDAWKPQSAYFVETFDGPWSQRWLTSQVRKDDGDLKYDGTWKVEPASVLVGNETDVGLVLQDAARRYAISARVPKVIDLRNAFGDEFVVQYEVKLQMGLVCGGAYIKLLTDDPSFSPAQFSDQTPYTIMFGPDTCGASNRVHFILRHRNPLTGAFEEKHLEAPPRFPVNKRTQLFTLVVRADNSFEIFIDMKRAMAGSLLTSFVPPVNPPAMIDDPSDVKPADWVDEADIPDPNARKPDDWDESQPRYVPDPDAVMPASWREDEPTHIPDPNAQKPHDWNDEEDGVWEAPLIPNPACENHGCGPWTPPLVRNPLHRGKWVPPRVPNPAFKGPWAPRQIPNPGYYHDPEPYRAAPIGAVGFELWTMQSHIMFDNIYLGSNLEDAFAFASRTWAPKAAVEAKLERKLSGVVDNVWEFVLEEVTDFVSEVFSDPVGACSRHRGVAMACAVVPALLSLLFMLISVCGSDDEPHASETRSGAGAVPADDAPKAPQDKKDD